MAKEKKEKKGSAILDMIKGGGTFRQTMNQQRRPAAYQDYRTKQIAAAEARRIAEEEAKKRAQQQAAPAPAPAPPAPTPTVDPSIAAMEAQRRAIEAQTQQALADAEAMRQQLSDQFRISQEAAAQRAEAQAQAQRTQMIRERGAGQAANLQIQGQPGFRGRGGAAGFRRRKDQFKISPYQGVGGLASTPSSTASTNNMVNI